MTKERDNSIDIAKGLLIVFVLLGHVFVEGRINAFVYAFHIPAFFVVSGMLIKLTNEKDRKYSEILKKTFLSLIIPYIFFEILGGITYYCRYGFDQSIVGLVYNSVTMHCNNGPDWFLLVLFFAKLICDGALKLIDKLRSKFWEYAYYTASIVLLMLATVINIDNWYFGVCRKIIVAHGFVVCGYAGCRYWREKHTVLGLIAMAVTLVASQIMHKADLGTLSFGNPIVYFMIALLGTYGILQISKCFECKTVSHLGKWSLIVMGTHVPILFLIRHICGTIEFGVVPGLVCALVIIAAEFPIIFVITKYAPFIIGKSKPKKLEAKI